MMSNALRNREGGLGGGRVCGYECKRERKRACEYEYSYCILQYTKSKERSAVMMREK